MKSAATFMFIGSVLSCVSAAHAQARLPCDDSRVVSLLVHRVIAAGDHLAGAPVAQGETCKASIRLRDGKTTMLSFVGQPLAKGHVQVTYIFGEPGPSQGPVMD